MSQSEKLIRDRIDLLLTYLGSLILIPVYFIPSLLLWALVVIPFVAQSDRIGAKALICQVVAKVVPADQPTPSTEHVRILIGRMLSDSSIIFELYVVLAWVLAGAMVMLISTTLPRWQLVYNALIGLLFTIYMVAVLKMYALPIWMPVLSIIILAALVYPITRVAVSHSTYAQGSWFRSIRILGGIRSGKKQKTSSMEARSGMPGFILRLWGSVCSLALVTWVFYVLAIVIMTER